MRGSYRLCGSMKGERAHYDSFRAPSRGRLLGELPHNDGTDQPGSGQETMKPPAAEVPGNVPDAENPGGLARRKRNIEAIERMVKAVAEPLDEGFLARPAIEEAQRLVARGQRPVNLILAVGKKTCRDAVGVGEHAQGFDVDSDLVSAR